MTTKAEEPVLLGSAILGAVAGKVATSVEQAMAQFSELDSQYQPNADFRQLHANRYEAYKLLQSAAKRIREELQ